MSVKDYGYDNGQPVEMNYEDGINEWECEIIHIRGWISLTGVLNTGPSGGTGQAFPLLNAGHKTNGGQIARCAAECKTHPDLLWSVAL